MASVCDPLTGQCHCKVSRGLCPGPLPRLLSTYLLQLRHGPQRTSWAGGTSWELLGDKGEKLVCGLALNT